MAEDPALFVRVSLPDGHHTVPAAVAELGGWTVLGTDALDRTGHLRRHKPRTTKPRDDLAAATPHKPEAPASVDTPKE